MPPPPKKSATSSFEELAAISTSFPSTTLEATSPPMYSFPALYFAHPLHEVRSPSKLAATTSGFATRDMEGQDVAPSTSAAPSNPAEVDVLPELPAWLIGFMVGCGVFIVLVGFALLLAQIRVRMRWASVLDRWIKRKKDGYYQIDQEYELNEFYADEDVGGIRHAQTQRERAGGLKKRKAKARHLSVDTKQVYPGLGIAVPGYRDDVSVEEERWSLHGEVQHQRAMSATTSRGAYSVGSTPHFTSAIDTPQSTFEASTGLEAGCPLLRTTASSPEIFNYSSGLHETLNSGETPQTARNAFLDSLNKRVADAADSMARRFHDHVDGPEEGQLLPVRYIERER